MSSAGAARTRSRRSSSCTTASTTTLSLVLGLTRRGRLRPLVTRPRDLRPQGHPLPRGHAEAFQPSVHNCSRHVLGQPSQRLSFLSCTATYKHYDPSDAGHEDSWAKIFVHLPVPMISTGTEFSMQGCIGQNSVSMRASSRKTQLGNFWRDFAHVHDHQTASLSVSCAQVFGRTYPVPRRTLLKITCH